MTELFPAAALPIWLNKTSAPKSTPNIRGWILKTDSSSVVVSLAAIFALIDSLLALK